MAVNVLKLIPYQTHLGNLINNGGKEPELLQTELNRHLNLVVSITTQDRAGKVAKIPASILESVKVTRGVNLLGEPPYALVDLNLKRGNDKQTVRLIAGPLSALRDSLLSRSGRLAGIRNLSGPELY